ncbi:MAG: glycosyltransferase [Planctomycetes bacterium]|nr:glycosyltransferase [Planctomycetota bacterium]
MARLAIVSYHAPPQPAVASHRVLRMTRALLGAGHEVGWVTLDPAGLPKRDETLAALTPPAVTVHGRGRPNLVDRDPTGFVEKVLRTIVFALPSYLPVFDRHVEWGRLLRRELPGIVAAERLDAVLFCCGPHGQLTAVPRLRRRCPDVRVLIDYRDLLSGNTWRASERERLRRRVRERERRILERCEALFLNSADAKDSFHATFGEFPGLAIEVMRNTADYDLADEVFAMAPPVDLGAGAHLGFFGTIFPRRRLLPVLQALERVPAEVRSELTLHVYCDAAGSAALLQEDLAQMSADVGARVVRQDYLGYGDALRTMRAMDALVLINSPDPADQIFVPGKLYDYLMAQRPVLFVGEQGDAWNICAETTGSSWCFTHDQPDAIAERLTECAVARPADVPRHPAHVPQVSFAPLLDRLQRD